MNRPNAAAVAMVSAMISPAPCYSGELASEPRVKPIWTGAYDPD